MVSAGWLKATGTWLAEGLAEGDEGTKTLRLPPQELLVALFPREKAGQDEDPAAKQIKERRFFQQRNREVGWGELVSLRAPTLLPI